MQKTHDAAPRVKNPWEIGMLRPEWRKIVKAIFGSTAEFEEIAGECIQKRNSNPEDFFALLEILEASGKLNTGLQLSTELSKQIASTFLEEITSARSQGRKYKTIEQEKQKTYQTIDHIINNAGKTHPLAALLLQECGIVQLALKHIHFATIQRRSMRDVIEDLATQPTTYTDIRNIILRALNILAFVEENTTNINGIDATTQAQIESQIPQHTPIQYRGEVARAYLKLGPNISCRIECNPKYPPFLFGRAAISWGSQCLVFSISRFSGDLLIDGCLTTPLNTIMNDPKMNSVFKTMIWNTILLGIEDQTLTRAKTSASESMKPTDSDTSNENLSSDENKNHANTYGTQPHYVKPKTEQTANNLATNQTPPIESRKREIHFTCLSRREVLYGLRKCGVEIVGGGKHIIARLNGKSVSIFNDHEKGQLWYNSRIHQTLAALGVSPHTFQAAVT